MPPKPAPRDDDDVVEDYEVFDEEPSAKLPPSKSAQKAAGSGAPVMRKQPSVAGGRKPSAPVRPTSNVRPAVAAQDPPEYGDEQPEAYDPNKGKISAKSAKQIWIICIAITVIGLGAVGADIAFDPLGRRNNPATANNQSKANNKPKVNDLPKDPVAQLAENFKRTVEMEMGRIRQKKAFKFYEAAYNNFRGTRSMAYDAMADKDASIASRQKAWAEVYNDFYKAQYAKNLFLYTYRGDLPEDVTSISLNNEEERLKLAREKGDAILKEEFVRFQAASSLVDRWSADVNEFWTGMRKSDKFVGDVFTDDRYKPVFKASKDKYEKSGGTPPEFDPADLAAIKE